MKTGLFWQKKHKLTHAMVDTKQHVSYIKGVGNLKKQKKNPYSYTLCTRCSNKVITFASKGFK